MKYVFLIALSLIGIHAFAQCGGFEYDGAHYQGDEVPENHGNSVSYRIDGQEVGEQDIANKEVWKKVLSSRKGYALFIYRHSPSPIILEILDSQSNIIYSVTIAEKRRRIYFSVPKTGIYYMKYTFTGDCQYCSCAYAILSEELGHK